MKSNLYIFFFLLTNMFRTYEIHLFFETFFGPAKKKKYRLLFYMLFFLLISGTHIFFDIAILTLTLNILCAFLLTFYYDTSIGKRLLCLGFLFGLLCTCEALTVIASGTLFFSFLEWGNYSSVAGVISIPILPFIFILLYRRFKKNRENIRIPVSYVIMAVSVPVLCTYTTLLIFTFREIKAWQSISVVIVMFAIMIGVFWLYEKQLEFFSEDNRKKVLEVQNTYYQKQLEYMLLTENATRSIRHDMKNHLLSISALAAKYNDSAVVQYVDSLYHLFSPAGRSVASSNIVVDSILNSKLALASEKNIDLEADIAVPEKLTIHDTDLTILLGNLLDNAIENFDKANGQPIQFRLRYDKGRLLIRCQNPYVGTLRQKGRYYDTNKSDKENHGFGLHNINYVVSKYNGEIKIEKENNIFCAELLLYLE